MIETLIEAIIDSIKLFPFLFITYLIMEYIEHKTKDKTKEIIKKSGKYGPFIGGVLRSISTMWVFCISNKPLCSKSNYTWNINCSISINIRWNVTNINIRSGANYNYIINTRYKIINRNNSWILDRFSNKNK